MSDAITLVELLADLGGAELSLHRDESTIALAVVKLAHGRQLIAIERTYREGICIILDPTPEELEIARGGDPWHLWNSDRARLLHSVAPEAAPGEE